MVDNTRLTHLIKRDLILRFKCRGCLARDTFPILKHNEFVIVNTVPSSKAGEHWLPMVSKNDTVLLFDSLEGTLHSILGIFTRKFKYASNSHSKKFFGTCQRRRSCNLLIVSSVAFFVFL